MSIWRKFMAAGTMLAAALSGPAVAQNQAETAAPAPAQTTASPAMWRVSDADSEFILLGTFHILPPGLQWRTEALNQAIENADTVYFEVDTEAPGAQSKAINAVMLKGFNSDGKTLTSMLDASDAQKLREVIASLGLPLAGIDTMRPWNAFLTLSVQFIVKQGFDPGAGVDSVLLGEMRMRGKDLVFFETIEEQLGLFTGLDPQTEKDLLVLTLRDWDNYAETFDDLYNAWVAGDADFIDAQMNADMRNLAPEVYQNLIVSRNKAWAERLDADLKGGAGKALVAVGAAHLVGGKNSVPGLLAAKGYKVSRYGDGAEEPVETAPAEPAAPVAEPAIEPVAEPEMDATPDPVDTPAAGAEAVPDMDDISDAEEEVSVEPEPLSPAKSAEETPVITGDSMDEALTTTTEDEVSMTPAIASGGPQPLFTVEELPEPDAANDNDEEDDADDIGELLEALEDDERP